MRPKRTRSRTLYMLVLDTGKQCHHHQSHILPETMKSELITFDVQPGATMNFEENLAMSGCIQYNPDHLDSLPKEPQHASICTQKYFRTTLSIPCTHIHMTNDRLWGSVPHLIEVEVKPSHHRFLHQEP